MTESSFSGTAQYASTPLIGASATINELKLSVIRILVSNIIGMPYTGTDICGSKGDVTPELCTRWHFVGAFFPFAKNQRDLDASPREPYRFNLCVDKDCDKTYMDYMRDAIRLKYSLFSYYYTEMKLVGYDGGTFFMPMFFDFPQDSQAYDEVHNNFLIGPALKVSIQTGSEDKPITEYYFPTEPDFLKIPTTWCNVFDDTDKCFTGGVKKNYSSTMKDFNVHLKSSHIVPLQDAQTIKPSSTDDLLNHPIDLHINPQCDDSTPSIC